ncbi:hypothetical protein ACLOJK_009596 [Asimina triloba]
MDIRASYQFQEGNQAADFLVKEGELGSNAVYEDLQLLPRFLRGVIRIDKAWLPSIPVAVVDHAEVEAFAPNPETQSLPLCPEPEAPAHPRPLQYCYGLSLNNSWVRLEEPREEFPAVGE